jgi:1,4-alpha-glucan branching enzyme
VATGLLLTAPGVPMQFMGQEFLADRWWSDDPRRTELLIPWEELEGGDRHVSDFHRFCRDLTWLRRHPALRSDTVTVYPADNANRGPGLSPLAARGGPRRGGRQPARVDLLRPRLPARLPAPGPLARGLNSDLDDHFATPGCRATPAASAPMGPMHGMAQSAGTTIPANSVLVFAAAMATQHSGPAPAWISASRRCAEVVQADGYLRLTMISTVSLVPTSSPAARTIRPWESTMGEAAR